MRKQVHQCLRIWNQSEGHLQSIGKYAAKPLIEEGLVLLASNDPFSAELIRRRFKESKSVLELANVYHFSQDQINRKQSKAIDALALIVGQLISQMHHEASQRKLAKLPPARYENLYGMEDHSRNLVNLLCDSDGYWALAVTGLGGIGKSALVHTTMLELAKDSHFDDFLWLRFEQQDFDWMRGEESAFWKMLLQRMTLALAPQNLEHPHWQSRFLRELREKPKLIVLDNLDEQSLSPSFCEKLATLVNPSKLILTSRAAMPPSSQFYQYALGEIKEPAARHFILEHARSLNVQFFPSDAEAICEGILQVTGGNPLAIRLAVGLLLSLPLGEVMRSFADNPGKNVEQMYREIFLHSWETLSPLAQRLLQAMPLLARSGGTREHLLAISAIDEEKLDEIIQELISRSLIEMQGSVLEPIYGIHVLTESFLQAQVLKWS